MGHVEENNKWKVENFKKKFEIEDFAKEKLSKCRTCYTLAG